MTSRVGSRAGYQLQLIAGVGWTSLPGLPFVQQPTLILAGSDDPIIPLVNARCVDTFGDDVLPAKPSSRRTPRIRADRPPG